jgi:hypothetical protein
MGHLLFSEPSEDRGATNPAFTDEWLTANGHDRQWLQEWFMKHDVDSFAMQEWVMHHKYNKDSDPRLLRTPGKAF